MPSDSSHNHQERLGEYATPAPSPTTVPFAEPPIPPNQDEMELLNPIDTLDVLRDPASDVRNWLSFIEQQYEPPDHVDVLLLYPCAAEKPMPNSKTYSALSKTMAQYSDAAQRRVHVVTVSEPMGLIPYEYQDADDPQWLYDNPGLFEWWVKNNDHEWNTQAQQQCLRILGEHIAGFLERALENDWYDTHIACVRHMTAEANESSDQTHRQMLETAEAITDIDLTWLPTEDIVTSITEERGSMAWQMTGVAHEVVQAELAEHLDQALQN